MSYNSQALTAYKETRVKTASPGSLIIMLYDEGIKNITLALEGMPDGKIEAENIERIHQYILKAQDIITEWKNCAKHGIMSSIRPQPPQK